MGSPIENVYVPLVHYVVGQAKNLFALPPESAYHIVTAVGYSLAPVSLYILLRTMALVGKECLLTCFLFSVFSPSAMIDTTILQDLGGGLSSQRLRVLSVYGEGPHVASLFLVPLVLACLYRYTRTGARPALIAGTLSFALLVGSNTPGTLGLLLLSACLMVSFSFAKWKETLLRFAQIFSFGSLCSLLIVPTSYWAAVLHNSGRMHPGFLSSDKTMIYYAALLLILLMIANRCQRLVESPLRFFAISSSLFLILVVSANSNIFEILPQAHRFHVEMEMPLCALLGVGFVRTTSKNPYRSFGGFLLFVAFCVVSFAQMKERRRIDHVAVAIGERVEYRAARWANENLQWQRGRLFTSGSTSFWFNAFSRQWQLGGCCDQGNLNDISIRLSYMINLAKSDTDIAKSIYWAQALGVQALVLPNAQSNDAYKDTQNPSKFDGRLVRLAAPASLDVFKVPQARESLVQVVDRRLLVPRHLMRETGEFAQAIEMYVKSLKKGTTIRERWLDEQTLTIAGRVDANDVFVVQMNYSDGWRASGNPYASVYSDGLGTLVIDPGCKESCPVELKLDWTGQSSTTIGRIVGGLTLVGLVGWLALSRKQI